MIQVWTDFWVWWGDFTVRAQQFVRYEWLWTIVTSAGHGLVTWIPARLGTLIHPLVGLLLGATVATWYTQRELRQARAGSTEPLIGSVLDVVVPWYVLLWLA